MSEEIGDLRRRPMPGRPRRYGPSVRCEERGSLQRVRRAASVIRAGLRRRSSRYRQRRSSGPGSNLADGGNVGRRRVQAEDAIDFGADRRENLSRRGALRNKRRHAPQRRLLGRDPFECVACTRDCVSRLGVRDGRGDQLGEPLEAVLRLVGQTLAGRKDRDRAPQAALDENRVADGRDDADALRSLGGRTAAGRPVERVHAGGASGAVDLERGHPLLELPARPDRDVDAARDADGDDPESVLLEPQDEAAGGEELRHLVAHGREDLARRYALRDECCQPQERGLLLGEPSARVRAPRRWRSRWPSAR